ncbi:MAG TPA: M20/M25/M40 family metallo-hydrolase [Chlamydiales bacterium]|nr:M20/M25/M40 family metallo-hydrolase [Chlamydiales bacterium]
MEQYLQWFEKNFEQIKNDYFELLKFETINADPSYRSHTIACVNWLKNYLEEIHFEAEIIETMSAPLVFGQKIIDPKLKTLLFYFHYDVMPVDPIEEWAHPPFNPQLKEGVVYARGASDDKGQLFYALSAMKALDALNLPPSVNIKVIIDGEEESGSVALHKKIEELKEKLSADYLAVLDLSMPSKDQPAINIGARGMVSVEMQVKNASVDMHSGEHGGVAYNPLLAICKAVSKLHDDEGHIAIKDFYDDVKDWKKDELQEVDLSFDKDEYQKDFGVHTLWQEKGFQEKERNWLRPTIEIHGIKGGYTGPGFKSVIPSKASVKISSRLVSSQDPRKVIERIINFLKAQIPIGMEVDFVEEVGGEALLSLDNSPITEAAIKAYEKVFKTKCTKVLAGGSVPIVASIAKTLHCPFVMMGTALPTDNIHAPNEHFMMEQFQKGFLVVANMLADF